MGQATVDGRGASGRRRSRSSRATCRAASSTSPSAPPAARRWYCRRCWCRSRWRRRRRRLCSRAARTTRSRRRSTSWHDVPAGREPDGAGVEATLERHGFYPAGGGRFTVAVDAGARAAARRSARSEPATVAASRARWLSQRARARSPSARWRPCGGASAAGGGVPNRSRSALARPRQRRDDRTGVGRTSPRWSPGSAKRASRAENVANRAVDEARAYLRPASPSGRISRTSCWCRWPSPAAGAFRTVAPTAHTRTNADVIERFLPVDVDIEPDEARPDRVDGRAYPGRRCE